MAFSTLGWPNNILFLRILSNNVLVQDLTSFFWVARMIMMGLFYEKNSIPHIYIHPLVKTKKEKNVEIKR